MTAIVIAYAIQPAFFRRMYCARTHPIATQQEIKNPLKIACANHKFVEHTSTTSYNCIHYGVKQRQNTKLFTAD